MAHLKAIELFNEAVVNAAGNGEWIAVPPGFKATVGVMTVGVRTAGNVQAVIEHSPYASGIPAEDISTLLATASNTGAIDDSSKAYQFGHVRAKITVPSSGVYADVVVKLFSEEN